MVSRSADSTSSSLSLGKFLSWILMYFLVFIISQVLLQNLQEDEITMQDLINLVTFSDSEATRRACFDPIHIIHGGRRANYNHASLGRPRPPMPYEMAVPNVPGRLRPASQYIEYVESPRGSLFGNYPYQQGVAYPYRVSAYGPEYMYSQLQALYGPYMGQNYLQVYTPQGYSFPGSHVLHLGAMTTIFDINYSKSLLIDKYFIEDLTLNVALKKLEDYLTCDSNEEAILKPPPSRRKAMSGFSKSLRRRVKHNILTHIDHNTAETLLGPRISAHLQIHGDEKEFIPLSAHHLTRKACPGRLLKEGKYETRSNIKHCCFGYSRKAGFTYVTKNGIPREAECDTKYDCLEEASIPADDEKLYTIDGVITYETIEDVFEALRTHPITASLVCYTGWGEKKIYRGPLTPNSYFISFHAVIIVKIFTIDGETIALCKSSNGINVGFDGYLYVSLDVMVKTLGMSHDPKSPELDSFKTRCSSEPEHLLIEFCCPLSNQQQEQHQLL
ncbi:unnamed protein product [Cochlearia groenlandica]